MRTSRHENERPLQLAREAFEKDEDIVARIAGRRAADERSMTVMGLLMIEVVALGTNENNVDVIADLRTWLFCGACDACKALV